MKQTNLVDFGELCDCANKVEIWWNDANVHLNNDGLFPSSEHVQVFQSDVGATYEQCAYSWSLETWKILNEFFRINPVTEITIVR